MELPIHLAGWKPHSTLLPVFLQNCKFKDCTHTNEVGCSVLEAVENGEIDKNSYENYLKMEREKAHFESTIAEKRNRDKQFGKMMKNYKKDINKNKNHDKF